jgi:hypothetical protein
VVSKATGLTMNQIEWQLPLAKGWAFFHAQRLLDGELMTWPTTESTPDGRWWLGVKHKLTNRSK